MAFFTDISNQFDVGIEFSQKKLHNIVRFLLVFCVLHFCVIQVIFPTPFAAAASMSSTLLSAGERSVSARLVCAEISDATVTLELFLGGGVSLCGLLAEVTYDASRVNFSSAKLDAAIEEQGGKLSYTDSDGRLTLALDCCHNLFSGDVVELVFAFADSEAAETTFELSVLSAYAWEGEDLLELSPCEPSMVAVSATPAADKDAPTLRTVEVSLFGDVAVLSVFGTAPERCFAAGVELCVADLSSFSVERVCAVGVIDRDGEKSDFIRAVELSAKGRFCVIVKPVSYCRTGAVYGTEIILLIENGEVVY